MMFRVMAKVKWRFYVSSGHLKVFRDYLKKSSCMVPIGKTSTVASG